MQGSSDRPVVLVSFSGVDGAGKSTQIERLLSWLSSQGLRVRVFRFWDDIATFTSLRETTGHKVFKGDKGIGSPEAPINRRDKNVRSWPMSLVRLFLYFADAVSTRRVFRNALRGDLDFIIFDRYTYDELANLNLGSWFVRAYVRFIMGFVPRPHVSFVLDADPEAARARKPEYPVDFIRINRQAYLDLNRLIGGLTVISPMQIEPASQEILRTVKGVFALDRNDSSPSPDTIQLHNRPVT